MITSLRLRNFKAFSTLESLRLAPITVLSGKNSSGKSTVLHSLLLLKQSLTEELPEEAVLLEGDYLQYTHLRELAFGLPQEASAAVEFGFALCDPEGDFHGSISFELRHKNLPQKQKRKGPVVNWFGWKGHKDEEPSCIRLRKGTYLCPRRESLELPLIPEDLELIGPPQMEFQHFLPRFLVHKVRMVDEGKPELAYMRTPILYCPSSLSRLCNLLRNELSSIGYLGPSRAVPRRAYVHYSERHFDLDDDGANAAHIFWLRRNELVDWRGTRVPLEQAARECLRLMGLLQPVKPKRSSKIVYQLLVGTGSDTAKHVTLADVGFGYSQVLPIILRGLLADKDALLLFEQPEIHLHPSSKARLADLFLAFKESGRRMVIETHSTELINCLQLRVIEGSCQREDINVVFVAPPEAPQEVGAQVRQLCLMEDGMFDEWPQGFCDESEDLARRILEASVRNRGHHA